MKVSFQQLTKNHHVQCYRLTGKGNLIGLPRNGLVYFIQLHFGKSWKRIRTVSCKETRNIKEIETNFIPVISRYYYYKAYDTETIEFAQKLVLTVTHIDCWD